MHDEEGARAYRTFPIQYDPDSQRVDLRLARVYRKDGHMLESVRTVEQQLGEPWYRIYYDTRALIVVFPDLEPGDVVELRYRIDDVAHRNLFADYYGDLHTWQGMAPIAHSEVRADHAQGAAVLHQRAARSRPDAHAAGRRRTPRRSLRGRQPARAGRRSRHAGRRPRSPVPARVDVQELARRRALVLGPDQGSALRGRLAQTHRARPGAKTPRPTREKVERIHDWVVQNTRYVALEFGIHGFMPYRVPQIVQRGFGDCKDKASLLYTMLREAGIDARIVLVRTRHNGAIGEQPASLPSFDHAIAYVPELDLYLDGTAEHSGIDELPVKIRA